HRHWVETSTRYVRTDGSSVRRPCHRARREHGREYTLIRAVRRDVADSGCLKQGRSVDTDRVFLHDLPMPCRTHRHWWEQHCPEIRMQASCWARTIVALASSDQSASGLVLPAHPQAG